MKKKLFIETISLKKSIYVKGKQMREYVKRLVAQARKSSYQLASLSTQAKNRLLLKMAQYLLKEKGFILRENQKDLKKALKNRKNLRP